jgi:hypothetical protein
MVVYHMESSMKQQILAHKFPISTYFAISGLGLPTVI